MSAAILDPKLAPPFRDAVLPVLRNPMLRKNVAHATQVIQNKRAKLVAEKTDWQELRASASAIRTHVLENLGAYLEQFEERCTAAGGVAGLRRAAARTTAEELPANLLSVVRGVCRSSAAASCLAILCCVWVSRCCGCRRDVVCFRWCGITWSSSPGVASTVGCPRWVLRYWLLLCPVCRPMSSDVPTG